MKKAIFYTYGLDGSNINLMPWRYLHEIARNFAMVKYETLLVSYDTGFLIKYERDRNYHERIPVSDFEFNVKLIKNIRPDIVYLPVSRRNFILNNPVLDLDVPKIAYFPSAWYSLQSIIRSLGKIPFAELLVYMAEALSPGGRLVRKLYEKNVLGLVTMTSYTMEKLVSCGWPRHLTLALPPSLEGEELNTSQFFSSVIPETGVNNNKNTYLLFLGPPREIRGIYVLCKAFNEAASYIGGTELLCLIRGGTDRELRKLTFFLSKLKFKDRIKLITDSLDKKSVIDFMKKCHAVVLPFLLVPSEIPLSVTEALSCGKPVIITETGGTSEFVGDAGLVVKPGSVSELKRTIIRLINDKELFGQLQRNAFMCARERVSSWAESCRKLISFSEKVLAGPGIA